MDQMLAPLRRYAQFSGRAQRKEYWLFVLFQWFLALPWLGLFLLAGGDLKKLTQSPFALQDGPAGLLIGIGWAIVAALAIPLIAVQVRRLHDLNRTGLLVLLSFVPFGELPLLVLMCLDGTPGANRFGPDPKRRDPIYRHAWSASPDLHDAPPRPRLGGGKD